MKYPIGIQNFKDIRMGGYVYVDKTALIYKLADLGKYYFLSRPRRFGKSLLISTLEAYFQGKKELFGGLALERLETEWKSYPVLHLDLNVDKYSTPDNLDQVLNEARHWLSGRRFMAVIRMRRRSPYASRALSAGLSSKRANRWWCWSMNMTSLC